MLHESETQRRTGRRWVAEAARLVAVLLVCAGLIYALRANFGAITTVLDRLGPWAPVAFVAMHVVVVSLGFPVSILGFFAGASFGMLRGTVVLLVAGLLAAAVMFVVSRRMLSGRVRAFASTRPRLQRFLVLAETDSTRLMILMRLSPLHYSVVCYLLGASRVRWGPYLVTSTFVLPSAALQAYVGHTAGRLGRRVALGEGIGTLEIVLTVVGVLAAVLLLVMVGRLARRALDAEGKEPDTSGDRA